MVEGRLFARDPTIGQRVLQEVDEGGLVFRLEIEVFDPLRRIGEVTAAAVEVHDGGEILLAAVVEVGRAQPDVAQAGRLEGAVVDVGPALGKRGAVGAEAGAAGVFGGRAHADPVEALIAAVLVEGAFSVEEADRGVGQLGARMTLDALALAGESVKAPLLGGGQGLLVPGQEAIEGGLIGDEGRHVGLDGLPQIREKMV